MISSWFLGSCAVFDTQQTAQLYDYPPPIISEVSLSESTISITITSDMYYPDHEDFSYYVILSGPSGTDFQTALDEGGLDSMSSVKLIPNYLTNTTKPSSAGNYLNPITIGIPRENFNTETDYDFAAIAYGYNSSYGRLYENNGWIYSQVSLSQELHNPLFTSFTVTNNQGLLFSSGNWQVADNTAGTDGVDFFFISNISIDPFSLTRMEVKGSVGISPLGLLEDDAIVTLPSENYVYAENYSENYFIIIQNHTYALKEKTGSTYAKLFIESLDEANQQVVIKLIYSTIQGVTNF